MGKHVDRRLFYLLYSIAFLDLLGVGLVVPLLPQILERFTSDPATIGMVGSVYGLVQVVSSPIAGRVSDLHGRKRTLIVCLWGVSVSYLLLGLSASLELAVLTRFVAGSFKHTQAIVRTAVAQMSTAEERAGALGRLNTFSGLGMVVGPALGGELAQRLGVRFNGMAAFVVFLANFSVVVALFPSATPRQARDRSASDVAMPDTPQELEALGLRALPPLSDSEPPHHGSESSSEAATSSGVEMRGIVIGVTSAPASPKAAPQPRLAAPVAVVPGSSASVQPLPSPLLALAHAGDAQPRRAGSPAARQPGLAAGGGADGGAVPAAACSGPMTPQSPALAAGAPPPHAAHNQARARGKAWSPLPAAATAGAAAAGPGGSTGAGSAGHHGAHGRPGRRGRRRRGDGEGRSRRPGSRGSRGGDDAGLWAAFRWCASNATLMWVLALRFVLALGVQVYHSNYSLWLRLAFQAQPAQVGYSISAASAAGAVASLFVGSLRRAARSDSRMALLASAALCLCMLALTQAPSLVAVAALNATASLCTAVLRAAVPSMLVASAGDNAMGRAVGAMESVTALVRAAAPALAGLLMHSVSLLAPVLACAALSGTATAIVLKLRRGVALGAQLHPGAYKGMA